MLWPVPATPITLARTAPATAARIRYPYDLAHDALGNVYIADTYNSRVRRVDGRIGIISTVRGAPEHGGPARPADWQTVLGVTVDRAGNVYVAGIPRTVEYMVDGRLLVLTDRGVPPNRRAGRPRRSPCPYRPSS